MHPRPQEETAAGRYSEEVASMEGLEARVAALEGQMTTRVGALEERMGLIRKDAAAARVLAGGADRDVADISAKLDIHKSLIQALRTTQIDMQRTQTEHGTRLDAMQETLAVHSENFAKLAAGQAETYAKLAAGQAVITDLLTRHLEEGSTN